MPSSKWLALHLLDSISDNQELFMMDHDGLFHAQQPISPAIPVKKLASRCHLDPTQPVATSSKAGDASLEMPGRRNHLLDVSWPTLGSASGRCRTEHLTTIQVSIANVDVEAQRIAAHQFKRYSSEPPECMKFDKARLPIFI